MTKTTMSTTMPPLMSDIYNLTIWIKHFICTYNWDEHKYNQLVWLVNAFLGRLFKIPNTKKGEGWTKAT